jgi:transcriptional regulator with XRE-family HTH domain
MSVPQSKIDMYDLGEKVVELRHKNGLSLDDAADVINEKYLPEGAEPISHMSIARWEISNNCKPVPSIIRTDQLLTPMMNTYDRMCELLSKVDRQIQKVNFKLNEKNILTDDYVKLSAAYEKLISRKQAILNDITKYQRQIQSSDNTNKLLGVLIEELKKEDIEVYTRFVKRIQQNKEMFDMLRGS